ncbi:hypothetical protein NQZ68_022288, partial [Dissostichus eleginoides]
MHLQSTCSTVRKSFHLTAKDCLSSSLLERSSLLDSPFQEQLLLLSSYLAEFCFK